MRNLFFLLCFMAFVGSVLGQSNASSQIVRCNTFESMKSFRKKHPGAETEKQFERWISNKIEERSTQQRVAVAYTIPIIFHIVHNGEAVGTGSNLSAAIINAQLTQLNKDYANLSGSAYGVAANTEIQFCLAKQAPDGTPLAEAGIERIDRNSRSWNAPPYDGFADNSYVDTTIMPNSIWDPYRYFNVWTMDLSGGLLGKATFPVSSGLPGLSSGETDTHAGVFVYYASVGSLTVPGSGAAAYNKGRTLSHEAGHFFGLRHIWGDATCGDDYCADTPPQDAETSGCPATGTLNNCVPSGPKMFENYMDYTDDGCVNTFTNNQKTRMQTVMANSPRRITLGTSDGCLIPAANSIRFTVGSTITSETGTGSCPRSKTVVLTLKVSTAATGAATVTFTKSGNATDNVDYFISPASVSYTNGDNTNKNVTVTIYDDAVAEGLDTITIGYTISGAGVVNGTSNQSSRIIIVDDDITPTINNAGTVSLLAENFGTSGSTLPTGWATGDFLGTSTNVWVVNTGGGTGTVGRSAYITQNSAGTPPPNTYNATAESEVLLRTPLMNATGLRNLKTTFKYKCNGEASGGSVFDFGTILYSLDGSTFYFLDDGTGNAYIYQGQTTIATVSNLLLANGLDNKSFYLGYYWYNDLSVGGNPGFTIDTVAVSGTARAIESTAAATGTENVFSGQDVYLYSATGNLIARITNPNANLGCLTGTVSQAGTGQTSITTAGGSFLRTQKVIQISPASANTTVTYQGSLYFSTAELSIWGANRLNLKILKVKDGVNIGSTTLNGTNSELITPTAVNDNPAAGYVEYRGNFTGFSQFMLVEPATTLPLRLLSFNAYAQRRSIKLEWKTTAESNMRGFDIERSSNGTDFTKIGFVQASNRAGNTINNYSYNDLNVQANITYQYRLRLKEFDGTEKFSEIRPARINESFTQLALKPNPVKDVLYLFITSAQSNASVSIYNQQGQKLYTEQNKMISNGQMTVDVSKYPAGMYTVVLNTATENIVQKFIKE